MKDLKINDFLSLSKQDIIHAAQHLAGNIVQQGNANLISEFTTIRKAILFLEEYAKELRSEVENEVDQYENDKVEFNNCQLELFNGRRIINYSEDPEVKRIEKMLSDRKKMVKNALTCTVVDEDGVEVPKVTISYLRNGLKLTIK